MNQQLKRSWQWMLCFCCLSIFLGGCLYADSPRPAAQDKALEQLATISTREQSVVRELFALSSNIQLLNTQIAQSETDIAALKTEIIEKQMAIDRAVQSFGSIRDSLGQVLKSQQRAGAASSLEVILNAESLQDLIRRINLLRDLSRKTSDLMATVETARQKLQIEKLAMDALLANLQTENRNLKLTFQNQQVAKVKLEKYLSSLSAERSYYETYLLAMERQWTSLKPLFSEAIRSFNSLIQAGGLPPETLTVSYSLFESKATLSQSRFNAELAKRKDLESMRFDIKKSGVHLEFPDYHVILKGSLKLVGPQKLEYVVTGGDFYGMPMNDSAVKDLFSNGALVFDLKAMLGRNTLKRIETHDGYLILYVGNSL